MAVFDAAGFYMPVPGAILNGPSFPILAVFGLASIVANVPAYLTGEALNDLALREFLLSRVLEK